MIKATAEVEDSSEREREREGGIPPTQPTRPPSKLSSASAVAFIIHIYHTFKEYIHIFHVYFLFKISKCLCDFVFNVFENCSAVFYSEKMTLKSQNYAKKNRLKILYRTPYSKFRDLFSRVNFDYFPSPT